MRIPRRTTQPMDPTFPNEASDWLLGIAGAAGVLVAGIWALGPLAPPPRSPPAEPPGPSTPDNPASPPPEQTPALVALNRSAFHTPLWIAPPPPPPPPPPVPSLPPSPPFSLQLLAIVPEDREGVRVYRAMLYDPDTDKVLLVAPGERLGTRMVDAIDQLTVNISDERGTRVLTLKTKGGTP